MTAISLTDNPFKVLTPEDMDAADVQALFVDVFTDFYKISNPGHTMVSGPRGCGKSMMFRYLLPDCQRLARKCELRELPFCGILVSIKNTMPNLTELHRLEAQHADAILNEHILTVFVANKVFTTISRAVAELGSEQSAAIRGFVEDTLVPRLRMAGWTEKAQVPMDAQPAQVFFHCAAIFDRLYAEVNQYAKRLALAPQQPLPYAGALCGYLDVLFPVLQGLRALAFLPDGPFYVLIDDADYLNRTQTRVLNSWVSTRTAGDVSIKISTQLRYKTLATIAGPMIQSPHDYQEINIADVYTSSRSRYPKRVEAIVKKRLMRGGWSEAEADPREFFPVDKEQEDTIYAIAQRIKNGWSGPKGYRPDDDVTRYARPEFFKSLAGASKSTSSYSYAGFDQLVHISSGLIRYFLEPAAQMYDEERAKTEPARVRFIRQGIQDSIIRGEAERLMFSEFDKMREDEADYAANHESDDARADVPIVTERLRNLLRVLGNTFYQKLVSEDSERRVFSVAISGTPAPELVRVFDLGVRYGYFHRSSIGNKDGTGRTRLYVLTRRLAPHFNLDPSSFAGYLFATNDILFDAMHNPDKTLRKIKETGVSQAFEQGQLTLFD
jgi:hypothetical protein